MATTRPESAPPEVTKWLAHNALPLASPSAGTPSADLRPLKEVLGGARIVGLGESTHGTGEFFRLKHRLIEFLVTELGCTVVAMEASASAAPAVDAYIRDGVGDPAEVLAGLGFWTWRTREVLDLIEWLRGHNRGLPDAGKVRFVGVDPQRCGASLELLDGLGCGDALLSPLRVLADADPGSLPDPERRLVDEAERVLDHVRSRFPDDVEAIRHSRILVRAADLVTRPRRDAVPEATVFAARDRYMADAVTEVLDGDPSAKVALWAHNGHLARSGYGMAIPALGRHLRERYGEDYYALGLVFGEGVFRARRVWPGPWNPRPGSVAGNRIGPAPAGTVEAALAAATPADHIVDLRAAADSPEVWKWLSKPHLTRTFGAVVQRWVYRLGLAPSTPAEEFDGLAYVAESTESRGLAG